MAFLDSPDLGVHGPGIGMTNKRHELVASLIHVAFPLVHRTYTSAVYVSIDKRQR